MAIGAVAAAAESETRRCGAAVWSSREAPVGGEEDAEECGEDEGDEDVSLLFTLSWPPFRATLAYHS